MASPAISTPSTPSTAGSPPAIPLAPAPANLAIKISNTTNMLAAAPVRPTATSIITRKEWVIPPRPKPGRKPATDTPPTKRKAQNRAAQRAFRERRAARVGELEEQLEETKEETQRCAAEMRAKIVRLEADLERFNGELQSWRVRCDTLDRIADYERREKEAALAELSYLRHGSRTTGTDAVPLPPRRARQTESYTPITQQHAQHVPSPAPDVEPLGCGGCTSTTDCACVEAAMNLVTSGCGKCTADGSCECLDDTIKEAKSMELKRPHSPSTEVGKRQRQSQPSTPLEIDFTAQFSYKPLPPPPTTAHARAPHESCGFCEEGTYCMCAEAATVAANERENENRLAPLLNEVTPPPSDNDVDGSNAKLPSMQPSQMHQSVTAQASSNSCGPNGPGTCQQCQSDPKSGLFCRSLAAKRASTLSTTPDGCCGGNAGGGGCCKSVSTTSPSEPPPSLSCADTYKTLSTHKDFDKASDDLGSWLGRLHAIPPHHAGRAPMEVEAASVMGVLKLFDRRFGRG
jgi:Minimal binding motif of Hap4 for binding to Hap2/3/5